jgi:hypothetical protein
MLSLSQEDKELLNLLNRRPDLKKRAKSILSIAEDDGEGIVKADEAENRVIEEVRRTGNEVLTGWAESRTGKSGADLPADGGIVRSGQKKTYRHTTFGVISVFEQEYRQPGKRFRPFSRSAGITCRCCSLPLQRAVTDFGADHAFGRVPEKLKEHYGITLPVSTVRNITETHARYICERRSRERIEEYPGVPGRDCVIAETDGSMVPVVVTDKNAEDRRKGKEYLWKEARLSIAHVPGETTLRFGAEFQEGVDGAGKNLFGCACRAGFGTGTYLHSVGDGAPRTCGQVEKQFGSQGHYLVDFYHVCEYLEGAAPLCYSETSENRRCMVDAEKRPVHAFPES